MKSVAFALLLVGLAALVSTTSGSMKAALEDCGFSKSCYGFPAGCVETSDCIAVVSGMENEVDGNYIFEAVSDSGAYVAVGVSHDGTMGDTSVVACLASGSAVTLSTSYNVAGENTNVEAPPEGVELIGGSVVDGVITCSYSRPSITVVGGTEFDLDLDPVHLLIAVGSMADGTIQYHDILKSASITPNYIHDNLIFD